MDLSGPPRNLIVHITQEPPKKELRQNDEIEFNEFALENSVRLEGKSDCIFSFSDLPLPSFYGFMSVF